MGKTTAILAAGGTGRRFGARVPKQLVELAGRPILAHTLEAFESCPRVDSIVVVSAADFLEEHRSIASAFSKVQTVVAGGRTRQESSFAGVKAARGASIVVIHDAVRPFVTHDLIAAGVDAAEKTGAAVTAVQTVDTILRASDSFVTKILERPGLMNMQTPQTFRYETIYGAHEKALEDGLADATDDVLLVLRTGGKVAVVAGFYENLKITTSADLLVAESALADRARKR